MLSFSSNFSAHTMSPWRGMPQTKVIVPLTLIVCISWAVFWMKPDALADRMSKASRFVRWRLSSGIRPSYFFLGNRY